MEEIKSSPIIIQSDNRDYREGKKINFSSLSIPKIVFFGLIAIIVIELIWGAWYLLQPLPTSNNSITPSDQVATLSLSSDLEEITVGQIFDVEIMVSTAGQSSNGVDLVLKYDPTMVEPVGSANDSFTPGDIYSEYLGYNLDSEKGIFRVSGISGISGSGFSGDGTFGVLQFRALGSGATEFSVEHQLGQTADSNVINSKTTQDLLVDVSNLEVDIK